MRIVPMQITGCRHVKIRQVLITKPLAASLNQIFANSLLTLSLSTILPYAKQFYSCFKTVIVLHYFQTCSVSRLQDIITLTFYNSGIPYYFMVFLHNTIRSSAASQYFGQFSPWYTHTLVGWRAFARNFPIECL